MFGMSADAITLLIAVAFLGVVSIARWLWR